jgi:hypothetical protein
MWWRGGRRLLHRVQIAEVLAPSTPEPNVTLESAADDGAATFGPDTVQALRSRRDRNTAASSWFTLRQDASNCSGIFCVSTAAVATCAERHL